MIETKIKPWSMQFDKYGGYDCMSAAYLIYDAKGELILKIDLDDFTDDREAKAIAESIVKANQ